MAVTYVPRREFNPSQVINPLLQVAQLEQQGDKLDLAKDQFEESKKSGKTARIYQEALGEHAKSTSDINKFKLKVFNANPAAARDFIMGANKAQRDQIFSQKAMIDLMRKESEFKEFKANADLRAANAAAEGAIKQANAKTKEIQLKSAEVMNAMNVTLKQHDVATAAREKRDAEAEKLLKGMGPDGTNAGWAAFRAGKPIDEVGKIALAADLKSEETKAGTEREQRIAEKKLTSSSLKKGPKEQKKFDKSFGSDTLQRVQDKEALGVPAQPYFKLSYDSTPGSNKNPKNWGGGKKLNIDYEEAVKLDKEFKFRGKDSLEKQWLDRYEQTFGEPYDIPGAKKESKKSVNSSEQPPADQVARVKKRYPKATFYKNEEGQWRVNPNE